jgi:hypothetical protein
VVCGLPLNDVFGRTPISTPPAVARCRTSAKRHIGESAILLTAAVVRAGVSARADGEHPQAGPSRPEPPNYDAVAAKPNSRAKPARRQLPRPPLARRGFLGQLR